MSHQLSLEDLEGFKFEHEIAKAISTRGSKSLSVRATIAEDDNISAVFIVKKDNELKLTTGLLRKAVDLYNNLEHDNIFQTYP